MLPFEVALLDFYLPGLAFGPQLTPFLTAKNNLIQQHSQSYSTQATNWQHVQPLEMHDACMLASLLPPQRKHRHSWEL